MGIQRRLIKGLGNLREYKIDLNDKYELQVGRRLSTSGNNDLYIYVSVTIQRKNSDFYLILSEIIYEKKWLSKIIGTWEDRVEKAEKKLIKKAKKTVKTIPV